MKRIMQIIFGFILTLTLASCVSVQNPPTKTPTPDNLPLAYVLIKPEDVQGPWKWVITLDDEDLGNSPSGDKTPTPNPDAPVNTTSIAFQGLYSEQYSISFTHIVKEYEAAASLPGFQPDDRYAEPLILNLDGINDQIDYECSQQSSPAPIQVFYCRVLVQYGNIESFLIVSGDPRIGQENIEMIIRQILLTVEDRIKRYQAQ